MKTKKYSNKLIKLQILKLHYQKKSYSLKQIEIHLNKISNILYKYHITNKKILFIGFPENFEKTLHNTKHILIPESIWFNGMLSNRTSNPSNSQTITKKQMKIPMNIHQLLLKLKKKIDLVIVCNLTDKATAIEESYIARVPVITLSKSLNILETKATYKSPGDYSIVNEKITNNNIFYSMMKTTLNRAIITKRIKSLNFRSIVPDFFKKTKDSLGFDRYLKNNLKRKNFKK